MINDSRWLTGSAVGGGLLWLGRLVQWWQQSPDILATVELLLLLAILVNTPLALSLMTPRWYKSLLYRWAVRLQPLAALAVMWAFLGAESLPVVWCIPWLLFAGLLALSTLAQLRQVFQMTVAECVQLVAMLYLPVGAAWLVAFQSGIQPLGFTGIIVLLTAVHFHYTGFAAIIWASKVGDWIGVHSRLYNWSATGFVAATPLIAVGITLSPLVEIFGVGWLMISLMGLAWVFYRRGLSQVRNWIARLPLCVAPVAMFVAISLAVIYGTGEYLHIQLLTIPQMVQWHGWLNGIGFVFTGLLGWRLADATRSTGAINTQPVRLPQT